jgi:hypothetical protein
VDVQKFPPALTKGFLGFAGLMAGAAVCVHLASYGPDVIGPILMNVVLVLFPLVFLVFGPAAAVLSFARIPFERIFAGLPVYAYIAGGLVFVYVFVDFFWMIQILPGQPEQDGPNFYFNNHGTLTPISYDAYLMGLMHAARLFSGHELIFFGFGALIGYQIDRMRSGQLILDVAPRDEAMERSPLPYPLSRVVALQTALPPEACAARLLIRPPRPAWTLFAKSQGLRGQASATEFRVEMAGPQSQLVYAVGRFGRVGSATGIRLLMTFKRWPLIVFALSIVLAPLLWAFMVATTGFPLPWLGLVFVMLFAVGGNFLFGLDQRRRLLAEIKRSIEAREIPPTDPEFALLT